MDNFNDGYVKYIQDELTKAINRQILRDVFLINEKIVEYICIKEFSEHDQVVYPKDVKVGVSFIDNGNLKGIAFIRTIEGEKCEVYEIDKETFLNHFITIKQLRANKLKKIK